jgi:ribosomal protein L31
MQHRLLPDRPQPAAMIALPSAAIALTLFPRLLGAIYLIAFLSLLVQVRGLYGAQGILPIADYTARLRRHFGARAWRLYPSLFWLNAGDPFLLGCIWAGVVLSLLLLAGIFVFPALILLWLFYLSFTSLGQDFLSFQWDALLLEAGFMTIFLPLADPASPLVAFAYHFFLFRFMLSAGVVKLASGDPNWRRLRALLFHYETQPLPNRLAWYAHQLPAGIQKLSCLGTFFFELVVPVLCLGPATLRLAACALLLGFQTLLLLSGSYGFFNLLTMVLCVPLLDDRFLLSPNLPSAVSPCCRIRVSRILDSARRSRASAHTARPALPGLSARNRQSLRPRGRVRRRLAGARLESVAMKTEIHPDYVLSHVHCSCGNDFYTRSTKAELHVELCSQCHPFYTGKQKLVDTGGRVERFRKRAAKSKKGE